MSDVKASDRPWNDPGPKKTADGDLTASKDKPLLHAIVLDFSSVSHLDTTGAQSLMDTRSEVERWADREVEVCMFMATFPSLAKSSLQSYLVSLRFHHFTLDSPCARCRRLRHRFIPCEPTP
jgi:hypothetical protein